MRLAWDGRKSTPRIFRAELQRSERAAVATSVDLPEDGLNLEELVARIERELIDRALERTSGNKGRAAMLLHLKRTTLVEKLKRLKV